MLAFAFGAALVLLAGNLACGGRGWAPSRLVPGFVALSGALGLTAAAVAVTALGAVGLPLTPATIVAVLVALVPVAVLVGRRARPEAAADLPPAKRLERAVQVVVVAALAVFAWKLARVPVWSWDHFAIWGAKARWLAAAGGFELDFLGDPSYLNAAPQYPLGFPVALLILSAGTVPGTVAVKLAHGLFAVGAVAVLYQGALRLSGSRLAAAALAGGMAISPLLWDSENLGLADVALAFWSLSAAGFLIRAADGRLPAAGGGVDADADDTGDGAGDRWWRDGVAAGLLLGFLPWIKEDGWSLAVFFLAATPLLLGGPRRRRLRTALAVVLPAAALALGGWLFTRLLLPTGVSFLVGAWGERFAARLADPGAILRPVLADLAAGEWFGFWAIFAVGWVAAVVARRRRAAVLGAVVVAQLGVYVLIYFASRFDPALHVETSFFRIAAALLPLAALSLAPLFGRRQESPPRRAPAAG